MLLEESFEHNKKNENESVENKDSTNGCSSVPESNLADSGNSKLKDLNSDNSDLSNQKTSDTETPTDTEKSSKSKESSDNKELKLSAEITDKNKDSQKNNLSEQDFEFAKDVDDDSENVDYGNLKKEELLAKLREIIGDSNKSIDNIKPDVDAIKACFYTIIKTEKDKIRQELIDGGAEGEIEIPKDPAEDYLKELLADYKVKRKDYLESLENQKVDNLRKKEDIIEKIKILANGEESLNKTFSEFKQLQKEWNEIGQVPAKETSRLWNNYQLQIERFYDFIKINKELRDLDLKKNLENKIELCEKAEDLLLETNVKKAYNTLQEYHELWKEIGPVEASKREEIWERFSESTKKIRKAYQDYFIELREERKSNYKQKLALCEKVEDIVNNEIPKKRKDWLDKTQEVLEIQKIWKTIGMVPKDVNEEVYQRFRLACNKFFDEKKDFFGEINAELKKNLQIKQDICVQAEGLQESTDWKKTSELFFDLQKKWKEVGPVPNKQSDVIWKRFRKACDNFFNAKEDFFSKIGEEQKENLKIKNEIIESINDFKPSDNQSEGVKKVKEFQSKWAQIGQVPFKEKDKIQKKYREALDSLYKKLNLSKKHLDSHNYKTRIETLKAADESKQLSVERSKISQKIKAISEDITLWENNMTFFAGDTKGLLEDFKNKVEKAKEEINVLKNRKKMIDLAIRDMNKSKDN